MIERRIMQYVNFIYEDSDTPELYTGPVSESDADYLRLAVPHLVPLSDEQYMTGPAAVLHAMAKYSYVLDGTRLYWCIEWAPGLLVVAMEPASEMQWVALRSPISNFGGREALPEDVDPDDDDDNPQYSLVFTPWDAQFDADGRENGSFVPVDQDTQNRFEAALERVNGLGDTLQRRYANDMNSWFDACKTNLKNWCGEGVRLNSLR